MYIYICMYTYIQYSETYNININIYIYTYIYIRRTYINGKSIHANCFAVHLYGVRTYLPAARARGCGDPAEIGGSLEPRSCM